jgi:methyl-accepting chemotaxis protein
VKNALILLNLLGVLGLSILCVAQWRIDRQLNTEIHRLETIRLEQAARLEERDRTVAGHVADLSSLREHLLRVTGELKETEGAYRLASHQVTQLTSEREQLRESVQQWAAAIEVRDEQLASATQQIQELAAHANQTVLQFNELATNYNAVVNILDERTRLYNELVAKLNDSSRVR